MKKLLFIHANRGGLPSGFTEIDYNILQQEYDVTPYHSKRRYVINPFSLIQQVRKTDLVFGWFASWHTFLPVVVAWVFGKPSLIVTGGYDVANLPEINYGSQRGGLRKYISQITIRMATHLICNSQSAKRETIQNIGIDPNKITMIYHGVESIGFDETHAREDLAITVGAVWYDNLYRKGMLPFAQAAQYLSNITFQLIGKCHDSTAQVALEETQNSNFELVGYLSDEDLNKTYQTAKVYVQVSQHEGFGITVAEAMSAGCVPVVTDAGSLVEVSGGLGVVVPSQDPRDVADGIEKALLFDNSARKKLQEWVENQFPMSNRESALLGLVHQLLSSKK